MENEIKLSRVERIIRPIIQHYNHEKYWKLREIVIDKNNKTCKLIKMFYLLRLKRMDAFNCASLGTHLNMGPSFGSIPNMPHGIRGVYLTHNAKIGKNATIHQHVTIGEGKDGAPEIGDNCFIGAGATIFGKIKIGNNVNIGANCVVFTDIPDNCTVVMPKPRIIKRNV